MLFSILLLRELPHDFFFLFNRTNTLKMRCTNDDAPWCHTASPPSSSFCGIWNQRIIGLDVLSRQVPTYWHHLQFDAAQVHEGDIKNKFDSLLVPFLRWSLRPFSNALKLRGAHQPTPTYPFGLWEFLMKIQAEQAAAASSTVYFCSQSPPAQTSWTIFAQFFGRRRRGAAHFNEQLTNNKGQNWPDFSNNWIVYSAVAKSFSPPHPFCL